MGTGTSWPDSTDDYPHGSPGPTTDDLVDAVNAIEADLKLVAVDSVSRSERTVDTGNFAYSSGTAVQNVDAEDKYFSLATATAGTAKIEISPDGTNYTTLVTKTTLTADLLCVPVRAGWYIKVTLTTSTAGGHFIVF